MGGEMSTGYRIPKIKWRVMVSEVPSECREVSLYNT